MPGCSGSASPGAGTETRIEARGGGAPRRLLLTVMRVGRDAYMAVLPDVSKVVAEGAAA